MRTELNIKSTDLDFSAFATVHKCALGNDFAIGNTCKAQLGNEHIGDRTSKKKHPQVCSQVLPEPKFEEPPMVRANVEARREFY